MEFYPRVLPLEIYPKMGHNVLSKDSPMMLMPYWLFQ